MTVYGERMMRVETEMQDLKKAFDEHKKETRDNFDEVNRKLDRLIEIRNKAGGILWFLGAAGVVVVEILHYFIGKH